MELAAKSCSLVTSTLFDCMLNYNLKLTKKMARHKNDCANKARMWTNGIMGVCEEVLPCYHYVRQKCAYISHSIVQKQREGKRSSNGLCVSIWRVNTKRQEHNNGQKVMGTRHEWSCKWWQIPLELRDLESTKDEKCNERQL